MTTSRDTARQRRAEHDGTGDAFETPNYIRARVAIEELLEVLNKPIPKNRIEMEAELEACAFVAKDNALIESCIRIQLRAQRELGKLIDKDLD
jgi:hypothetical protein